MNCTVAYYDSNVIYSTNHQMRLAYEDKCDLYRSMFIQQTIFISAITMPYV